MPAASAILDRLLHHAEIIPINGRSYRLQPKTKRALPSERSASSPLYPLLKRADERHVTMQAYDNPKFVEDMVRETIAALKNDARVAWCRVLRPAGHRMFLDERRNI